MNKRTLHDDGRMRSNVNHAHIFRAPRVVRHFIPMVLICALFVITALISGTGYALTLDEAVTQQLAMVNGTPCQLLLGSDDPNIVLDNGLQSICTRFPQVGTPSSSSSGGGAGTPATLPDIVVKRMEGKEKEKKETTAGANETVLKLSKRLSLFVSGEYERLNKDKTEFEDGYDSGIGRFTVGSDYKITDRLLAGLAFNASWQNGDFDGGGDFETNTYGLTLYGSFIPVKNAFLQIYGGYSSQSTDRTRFATFSEPDTDNFSRTGSPESDFGSDLYSAGIQIGYDHPIGGVTIGPRAGLDWEKTEYDSYSEKGSSGLELTFHDDKVTSLQSSLGLQVSSAISAAFGVVVPQASIYWKHEFDQDQRDVKVSFVGDTRSREFTYQTEPPDRDFAELNAGVSLVVGGGVQMFINYRSLLGHSFFNSHTGTIGLRVEL